MLRVQLRPRATLAAPRRRMASAAHATRLTAAQRALVERTARGPVGVVGAFASGKSTCAAQRVLWLDAQRGGRRVLALSAAPTDAAPLVALLDRATPFHALERRGHRVAGVLEWTQHTREELGLRGDALSFGALTAFLMHHAAALPLRAFHQRLATTSSMQLRRSVADMVRFFTTLEAHGVDQDTYTTFAATRAGETGDESHLELAHAYVVYRELQQRHDVRSWDGLVLDLQRAFANDPHCLEAATREFSDVVVDDLDRMTPAMVQTLALVLQQPHLESSMSFSHRDELVSDECTRLRQLHQLLKTLQPEIVQLPSDLEASSEGRAGVRHVAAQVLAGKPTNPVPPVGAADRTPVVTSLESETFEDETRAITALIKQHLSAPSPSPRRVTVFCPSKGDVEAVSQAFLVSGIRVNGRAGIDATRRLLFDEPGVDTLFSLLVALWSPSDTKHLYNVLRSEFVAFPPLVLSRLMEKQHRRKSHTTLPDVLTAFVESRGDDVRGIDDETLTASLVAAEKFLEIVRECRSKCHTKSVAEIVQLFLERAGHLERLLDPQTPRDARQAIALAAFLREIDAAQRVVESEHVPFVVPYLMQLRSARVVSISDDDSDRASQDSSDGSGVRVLPLTRYDLQEYEASTRNGDDTPSEDLVVLMSMRDAKFPGRLKRITWPLPTELMAEPLPVQTRAEFLAEAETLVYDALVQLNPSRIVVSYAKAVNSGASKKPEKLSRVLEPLWTVPSSSISSEGELGSPRGSGDPPPGGLNVDNAHHSAAPTSPSSSGAAAHAFEPSHLSYSQVTEYTRCPHQYYLSRVLGLRDLSASADEDGTGETNLAMMFGSAVHEAVAAFGAALQRGDTLDLAEQEAFRVLDDAWRREGFLSKNQEAFFLERARSTLRGFVSRHDSASQILAVEQTFECRLGRDSDVALRGVWDRVDRTADGAVVIREFKTNPSAQRRTQLDAAAEESLQLQIYLVAYEKLHGEAPRGATLEVLEEDGQPNAVGFVGYSSELRRRVDEAVDTAMAAIRRGDFDATPSFMGCAMCPYASSVCKANAAGEASE